MTTRRHERGWFGAILALTALAGYGLSAIAEPQKPSGPAYEGFVLVRGGNFQMGDLFGDGPFAMREVPVHEVQVDDFLLSRFEVTVAQFGRFVAATGHKTVAEGDAGLHPSQAVIREGEKFWPSWRRHWFEQGPDHPVVLIAWEDAIVYCNWLSRQHGLPPAYDEKTGRLLEPGGLATTQVRRTRGFRLPTEAEWEFAARERGRKIRFGNGQDVARAAEMNFDAAGTGQAVPSLRLRGDNLHPYNEPGPTPGRTTPVGSFRPNALGLYDMSGNAWEWCSDTGGSNYTPEKQVNPCAQGGRGHILRGGTYDTDAKGCRTSARIDWYERAWCSASGFRVALTVE
ncbi:MAG: SUMF1/EgtB/PvdO family nonheme iron enzyme [Bryobacteraceae bacterium]|jgi:formylglycine-generating enzyme required for sulfatase activity